MKKLLCLLAVPFFGCSTPSHTVSVKVESDPPGARVFLAAGMNEDFAQEKNRQYLGQTPFVWTAHSSGDGYFEIPGALVYSMLVPPVAVITAEPPRDATNLYLQRQVFHTGTIVTSADKVPDAIFFDMHKNPQ